MQQLIYESYGPEGVIKSKDVSSSSQLVLKEAEKLGVDWEIVPCTEVIKLTYRGKTETFHHQVPSTTTALAKYSCNNKSVTTNLLFNNDLSVPKGFKIEKESTQEYILSAYEHLQKPLVVKPSNGSFGDNITINITSYEEYISALALAFKYSSKKKDIVIVEEMFAGCEYRILVTRKKVIGVLLRRPASVVGNGKDTIETLVKEKNKNPIRSVADGTCSHLKIIMDDLMLKQLKENERSFDSVIPNGERVFLRMVSNISKGGDAIDFTDRVHPSVKKIAIQAINAIPGLSFAGVDFLSEDITKKQTKDSYTIIEINDSPGFDIHDSPYKGKNRHAAREFLFLMFPELEKKQVN